MSARFAHLYLQNVDRQPIGAIPYAILAWLTVLVEQRLG